MLFLTYINALWEWLFKILIIINELLWASAAYPEASRCQCTGLGVQPMCQNWRKTDFFNANASTPSQTCNLTNTLKVVGLKTLCMPVSATQVCLNVSQSIVCKNKSSLYIAPGCINLPLDTVLDLVIRSKLSSLTGTVALR